MTNTPPSLRLFELLETMCARGQPFSLGDAIEATGWPKPSVHPWPLPHSGGKAD